jgi:predicted DsbA family dithiol-disulfide isomerase
MAWAAAGRYMVVMSLKVTLYSDIVCPFCYIAEVSSLVRLQEEYDVELDWRGFELHPDTPPGGRRLAEVFGEARSAAMRDYLVRFAADFGVTGMTFREVMPSTRRALAVAEYARDQGRLHPFRAAAMEAAWRHGQDVEDPEVLALCARAAGLDPVAAVESFDEPTYLARVMNMGAEARRMGVTGIPTVLIGTRRVVGCQPYEVLAAAASAEGAPRRR